MTEITKFEHSEFGELRTIQIDEEIWFVGKDIAERLGYSETRKAIARHVDDDDKNFFRGDKTVPLNLLTNNNNNGIYLINESGVYSLILGSKLESSKRFKKWITSEVLPSLRKYIFNGKET